VNPAASRLLNQFCCFASILIHAPSANKLRNLLSKEVALTPACCQYPLNTECVSHFWQPW